ncbi:hypothetical protein Ancab_035410 [Ancistrocladus abbreviatus]
MGTCNSCIPGVFSSFTILQTHATGFCLGMHYSAIAFMHESYKANTIGTEEETEDAFTFVHVKSLFFTAPFKMSQLQCVKCELSLLFQPSFFSALFCLNLPIVFYQSGRAKYIVVIFIISSV